ncbi:MAG: hypothetical protein IJR77_05230 [Bacteroidales bacterium]|nr:hypothetical protein [Bacteroidales bacterium]
MIAVAQVLKSNGTDGELLLGFNGFGPEDIDLMEPVFIEFDGLPVPFFIESFTEKGNRALVRLTGIRSLADADEITGRKVFIEYGEEEDGGDSVSGWTVIDEDGTVVGTVDGYEDIPGNTCLWVDTEKGQVLIPFHEDLVLSMDKASKTLRMTIPSGLLPR